MFYDFEEEEQKVLYEYELGDLPSLSEEELLSVGAVDFLCCLHDEEDSNNFVKRLLRLKEKTSKLENITKLQSHESIFTPEVVQTLAECFPYVKTFIIRGWGSHTFAAGAIKSFQNFKKLRTLKIHNYDAPNYFRLQEFGTLKQLKYLIIDYTWNGAYNFESFAFLKEMNLDKIEIEGVISVYNPAANGKFNASILNNKILQQKESAFKKLVLKAAPGKDSCLKAAAELFFRGKIEKGIEYLYMYARDDQSDMPIPFIVSQDPENREVLHWQWHDNEKLIIDYFQKRNFLLKIYPKSQTSLADFDCYLSVWLDFKRRNGNAL